MSAPSLAASLVATADMEAEIQQLPGLSVIAPNFCGWALRSHFTWLELLKQHHWSFWHCATLSPYVLAVLHRLCYWRASSAINSSEIAAIAFYCSFVLHPKQCLSNEKLPMRNGNISLAKLLFSKSGFCVNIKPFIYNESISTNISSSYFNVICKNMYFFSCTHMERSKILQELADEIHFSRNGKCIQKCNLGVTFV